jgi:hypothetical protein
MTTEFILHSKQWLAMLLILANRIAAYVGGIRSGKTIVGAHFALQMILERPTELGGIFSNTNKQLTKATLKEFKGVLASYGLKEGVHYVVNKNPEKLFGYSSKFTDHSGVWSFWNGAQVFTFSLETQIRGVEFGWVWGDEVQDAKKEELDIVLGRMSGSKSPKTFYTLTPPGSNPEIDEMIYGEKAIPVVFGTTYDNIKVLGEEYILDLKNTYDPYTFRREVLCERVTLAGLNWLYSFDAKKHVSATAIYDPKRMVYVSIDFNMNPFVATLSHRGRNAEGKLYIHYFDTVELKPEQIQGRDYIEALVSEIRVRTPFQSIHNSYMVTGDANSGRRGDVIAKVGQTVWSTVVDQFKIDAKNQLVVANSNSTHQDSRMLCNAIFSNFPEVLIHPKCKGLIRDCEFAGVKKDGERQTDNLNKGSRNIVTQQLDLLDAMRYDLAAFNYDFIDIRG